MTFRSMIACLNHMRVFAWLILLMIFLTLSATTSHAAEEIVIPLEQIQHEAPVLPPPLWRTHYIVMTELALPRIRTFREKERAYTRSALADEDDAQSKFRILTKEMKAVLSYEHINGHFGRLTVNNAGELAPRNDRRIELDGDIYSAYFKSAWSSRQFSFGAVASYDHLNLDDFDLSRIGILVFGKYQLAILAPLQVGVVVGGNYARHFIDSHIVGSNSRSPSKSSIHRAFPLVFS